MKQLTLTLALAAAFSASSAIAADQDSDISLKGFGTIGFAHSNSSEADYVSNNIFQGDGIGRTRSSSLGLDSKLGVQLDWKATSSISVTAQALSKRAPDTRYSPELEWAYVKYAVSTEVDVRAGRIRPAIYLLSDFLDVNYANPWVRPPVEFYSSAPVSRMEGIDLLWRPTIGDVSMLVQPYVGKTKLDLPTAGDNLEINNIVGINVTAANGDFTYRFGYIHTKIDLNAKQAGAYINMLRGICQAGDPAACTQATALSPIGKAASFASLGVGYDNGDYFASGEYGKRATDSLVNDGSTWYVTAGMRAGKWTPHVTYSAYTAESPVLFTGGSVNTNMVATGLLQNNPMDQNSLTLGVRYDVAKNVALKAQWDRAETTLVDGVPGTGKGTFNRTTNAFNNQDNVVKVISFSADFVF